MTTRLEHASPSVFIPFSHLMNRDFDASLLDCDNPFDGIKSIVKTPLSEYNEVANELRAMGLVNQTGSELQGAHDAWILTGENEDIDSGLYQEALLADLRDVDSMGGRIHEVNLNSAVEGDMEPPSPNDVVIQEASGDELTQTSSSGQEKEYSPPTGRLGFRNDSASDEPSDDSMVTQQISSHDDSIDEEIHNEIVLIQQQLLKKLDSEDTEGASASDVNQAKRLLSEYVHLEWSEMQFNQTLLRVLLISNEYWSSALNNLFLAAKELTNEYNRKQTN